MTGKVHSFQSLGTVDGPGVRTVLFLQGCPLRCPYCHNPDTWDKNAGEDIFVDDAVKKILRYRSYFGKDGGVTVSGGEPLLQVEFVYELFTRLKEEGIGTALDTSGIIMNDSVKKLLGKTDIVLLDIKFSRDDLYKKYIGVSLSAPLAFLAECEKAKKRVIIRQVITPGINDTEDDVLKLCEILKLKYFLPVRRQRGNAAGKAERASEAAVKEVLKFELRHKKSRTAAVAARKSGRYMHKQQS